VVQKVVGVLQIQVLVNVILEIEKVSSIKLLLFKVVVPTAS
jgi:hypothetical protein